MAPGSPQPSEAALPAMGTDTHLAPDPGRFSATVMAITNAFGDPTRRQIYLFAHERDRGVTAAEVAERFELHPNVARHHLDKLAGGGYLVVGVERAEGGGAGRPSKRYRALEHPLQLDTKVGVDDLVLTLLGRALAMLPTDLAAAMAEEVGEDYGRAMARSMSADGHRSFQAALHTVADALTAHGFAAHTEGRGDQLRIVSTHCPFGEAAVEHPVICAVDRGMVKGMLAALYDGDATPEHESSLPQGDASCVTTF